ncbi:MAG: rhomboid family intramembrane serine protease [Planctomycetota bacterium]
MSDHRQQSSEPSTLRAFQLFFVLHCVGLLALRLSSDGEHTRSILDILAVHARGGPGSWLSLSLVTHVFLHVHPLEFASAAALLLFLGAPVERALGATRFTILYLGSAALSALGFQALSAAFGAPPGVDGGGMYLGGLGAGAAVLVAHVLLEPRRRALGMLPAPGFFIVGATSLFALAIYLEQEPGRFLEDSLKIPLGGTFTAEKWLDLQWESCIRETLAVPHLLGLGAGAFVFAIDVAAVHAISRVRMRRQIRLLEEELDARERVDALLAKISRDGVDSLTRREKKFLRYASARFYLSDRSKRVLSE